MYLFYTQGTIEEKVYQRQISKQGLSGAVVDAKSHGHVKFSLEDLKVIAVSISAIQGFPYLGFSTKLQFLLKTSRVYCLKPQDHSSSFQSQHSSQKRFKHMVVPVKSASIVNS